MTKKTEKLQRSTLHSLVQCHEQYVNIVSKQVKSVITDDAKRKIKVVRRELNSATEELSKLKRPKIKKQNKTEIYS